MAHQNDEPVRNGVEANELIRQQLIERPLVEILADLPAQVAWWKVMAAASFIVCLLLLPLAFVVYDSKNSEVYQLTLDINTLQAEVYALQDNLTYCERLKQQNSELMEQYTQANDTINDLWRDASLNTAWLHSMTSQVDIQTKEYGVCEGNLMDLEKEYNIQEEKLEEHRDAVTRRDVTIRDIQGKLEKKETEFIASLHSMSSQVDMRTKEYGECMGVLTDLEKEYSTQEKNLQEYRDAVTRRDATIRDMQGKLEKKRGFTVPSDAAYSKWDVGSAMLVACGAIVGGLAIKFHYYIIQVNSKK